MTGTTYTPIEATGGGLISVAELARRLNVNTTTVYRWLRDGACPIRPVANPYRIRFSAAHVAAYLAGDEVPAQVAPTRPTRPRRPAAKVTPIRGDA